MQKLNYEFRVAVLGIREERFSCVLVYAWNDRYLSLANSAMPAAGYANAIAISAMPAAGYANAFAISETTIAVSETTIAISETTIAISGVGV